MVCVCGIAVADEFGVDAGASALRVLEFLLQFSAIVSSLRCGTYFKDNTSRPFSDHEAGPVLVERPARLLRLFIESRDQAS